jgi:hypothetical protein
MLEINKPIATQSSTTIIRPATSNELSAYEKAKLANIEDNAQENKIEVIKINNEKLQIDAANKEVNINLGTLAFKNRINAKDLASEDFFVINCELDTENL